MPLLVELMIRCRRKNSINNQIFNDEERFVVTLIVIGEKRVLLEAKFTTKIIETLTQDFSTTYE